MKCKDHELRKVESMIPFSKIIKSFENSTSELGCYGYGMEVGMKCLYLQFRYDLSDREMEERLYQTPKVNAYSFSTELYFWRLRIPYFLEIEKLLLAKGI